MGSGSHTHFRLDLPASVAKLAGDELLVFREDRPQVKKKKRQEFKKCPHPSIIHHLQKLVVKILFLWSIFVQIALQLNTNMAREFVELQCGFQDLEPFKFVKGAASNCKQKEWLNTAAELFFFFFFLLFLCWNNALKFTSCFMFNAFTI